ncbi:hypothetical protein BHAOGJBA_4244 [Methylobacterium hispanicum]|uniref:Uncharacterized protein n=1 Tax=Methylobacterium hispanicum TaxID=270350 RepID=A0AAV4ZR84_9HYPH|nr:hypothetical protein [Methylobacterium hispanicum]GJD90702.1 hypothetical protein BHAOGJBA_4244 [Methylobacterium hispanicum]
MPALDLPTVRVLLRGPIDTLCGSSGRAVRREAVFDAAVPHDVEGVLRPFARFRRHDEDTPGGIVSFGGRLLADRPAAWERASRLDGPHSDDLGRVSPYVFGPMEYLREPLGGHRHRITGGLNFDRSSRKHFAVDGCAIPASTGEAVPDDHLWAQIAAMREEAAEAILLTPQGFFVPRPMPRWEICRGYIDKDLAELRLADRSPCCEERSFRLDRFEAASQTLRDIPSPRKGVSGDLLSWDAELAPPLEEDVVRLARLRAPALTDAPSVSPDLLEPRLVADWHDLRNAPGILSAEGRLGADRILQSAVRMIDHLMGFDGGHAWRPLRDRIVLERAALPVPASATGVRP